MLNHHTGFLIRQNWNTIETLSSNHYGLQCEKLECPNTLDTCLETQFERDPE
jgi:hypothetical protein